MMETPSEKANITKNGKPEKKWVPQEPLVSGTFLQEDDDEAEEHVKWERSVNNRSVFRAVGFLVGFQAVGDLISSLISMNMGVVDLGGYQNPIAAAITGLVIYSSMALLGAEDTYVDQKGVTRETEWWRHVINPLIWFTEMRPQIQLFLLSFVAFVIVFVRGLFVYDFYGWSILRQMTYIFSSIWVFIAVKMRKEGRIQIPAHRKDWSVEALSVQPLHDTLKQLYFFRGASFQTLYDDRGKLHDE